MKSKHRNRRFLKVSLYAALIIVGAGLLLRALGENKQLFKNPSDVVSVLYVQDEKSIKVGGLVVLDSVEKPDALNTIFSVVNFENADVRIKALNVHFKGVLPDLFREGQGVVITGKLADNGVFMATEVLAKHDENYMPKMPDS
ncbi:MAG: cytochrome c biogenesis protein CcmE [Robiginitomaculum sp.]|nr:MAG: cytochrome c biogenesis protein CcmE [Robiginitomaculum sp.]